MSRFRLTLLSDQLSTIKVHNKIYTLWISRCIATARERIPESIENDETGVSERSQQRGNLKDDGYTSKCKS
ncbi:MULTISPECIES: hypothetical protein [Photorhabdus]|uniref:Uncharacterized protein n=1 Tax=Photorhabdus kayaii TaxID=230088 RepID=A0ABX0B466_9GAMM|nr:MULTISPECIES: hypothetical protein [Photorhabdus]MCC8374237.1 hypothetical protein [Photorhabdus bodei]MCT8353323.1 hypothetical protein [Photorhabdus kayaii]MDB6368244.1 hypothetical protein [Photorhabdus bodei]NDL13928.1 hypothetical protein [Photorhabdus kayaii]NDL27444.1 hypothetical protein [Photorhabdus kayaii]